MVVTNGHKAAISIGAAIAAIWLYRTKVSGGPVPSVTTSEGFDLSPYGGPVTYPQGIKNFAQAIARAEGFGAPGAIPTVAHNPGDLIAPAGSNYPTIGAGIRVFASDAEGWNALYNQLYLILTNQSAVYTLDMTIAQMAAAWTGGDQPASWAANVARILGVDASAPLYSVIV